MSWNVETKLDMKKKNQQYIESSVFHKLVKHFRTKTNVQNIDFMNLAGFCRNCLSKWYMQAAKKKGINISYDEARKIIYGMPYEKWKKKYQKTISKDK